MKLQIKKASVDQSVYLFVQNSSVTTGTGLTGLVFNSASLVAYYVRPLGSATAITLATQTVTGAHADGGFVEVDAVNMPGIYRLDLPDAVIATGVNSVVVMLKGATNMAPVTLEVELVAYDPQSAASLGLTNLDAAVSSRLAPTVAARTLDVSAGGEAGIDWANVGSPTTVVGLSGTTVKTATDVETDTADIQARLPAALTAGGNIKADALVVSDKTGYALTTLESAVLHSGTAQAGAAGTITLAAGASATNDLYVGQLVKLYGGLGAGQTRTVTAYNGTTKVATVDRNWITNPDATSTYAVQAADNPDLDASLQVARVTLTDTLTTYTGNTVQTGDSFGRIGAAGAGLTAVALAAAGLDSVVVETGLNARQALSIATAAASGVLAGAATTSVTIAAAGVPATNRITATVDASGNRSAVTLAPPA